MRTPRAAHEHLGLMLDGTHPAGAYHWHHVLAALDVVTAERTPAHERVLRRAATFTGKLRLDERAGMPHSMPPEEIVRRIAVRRLEDWGPRRHAAVIRRARAVAEHER
jgi:hypothetical protein